MGWIWGLEAKEGSIQSHFRIKSEGPGSAAERGGRVHDGSPGRPELVWNFVRFAPIGQRDPLYRPKRKTIPAEIRAPFWRLFVASSNFVIRYSAWIGRTETFSVTFTSTPPPAVSANAFSLSLALVGEPRASE